MRKLIAILLLAGMLPALCGCGNISAPGETTEPSVHIRQAPDVPASDPAEDTAPIPGNDPTEAASEETGPVAALPIQPEPRDSDFVPVLDYIPDMIAELKYASPDNFTGQVIYGSWEPFLRYGTVKKLMAVQEQLKTMGLGLKLWDGFRPVSAQFALWEACPDPTYVANPETGFSSHSRGNTVDITLVDVFGNELPMPTGFDDFSALADRNYSDCPGDAAENAMLLQTVMEEAGFSGYYGEWWHFADTVSYPVEQLFEPLESDWYRAECEEFITLREWPDATAPEILRIPRDGSFLTFARWGDFLLVYYQGLRGYVLESYTAPLG